MKIDPNTHLGNMYQMYEEVSAENALKLTQILDLEIILYNTKQDMMSDGSPCWCSFEEYTSTHEDFCEKARQATKHLWSF